VHFFLFLKQSLALFGAATVLSSELFIVEVLIQRIKSPVDGEAEAWDSFPGPKNLGFSPNRKILELRRPLILSCLSTNPHVALSKSKSKSMYKSIRSNAPSCWALKYVCRTNTSAMQTIGIAIRSVTNSRLLCLSVIAPKAGCTPTNCYGCNLGFKTPQRF
jgi:hypothetical protein